MKTHTPIVDWLQPYRCFKWIRKGAIYFPRLPNWLGSEKKKKRFCCVQMCLCRLRFCNKKRKEKIKCATLFAIKISKSSFRKCERQQTRRCTSFKIQTGFYKAPLNYRIVGRKSYNAEDWGDFSLHAGLGHVLHTYAPGLDFTDIMPPHTKKTALWHITEGA